MATTQLKDKNNANIYPVVEDAGGSGNAGNTNLFNPSTEVSGKGVVFNHSGAIENNNLYGCVFVPLEYDTYYRMSGYYWSENGGTYTANVIALGKGTPSSFSNLQASDFASGAEWLAENAVNFTIGTNIYLELAPYRLAFKTPSKNEMASQSTTIGLVINTTFNSITPVNDLVAVEAMPAWVYDGKVKGKNVAFFGDSITWGTDGGFVGLVGDKAELNVAKNCGESGIATNGLADNVLHLNFRVHNPYFAEVDYTKFHAVVIQIGSNEGVKSYISGHNADINADIPDIGIYNVEAAGYPYTYSDSNKTISSVTVTEAIDFFTECFANTFYGNIALCVEYIRWKNPNCRVFLTTIPPNTHSGTGMTHGEVRDACIALAQKLGVQVLDAQVNAGLGRWNIYDWSKDNSIHFNPKGNEMWASYIANELDKKFYETEL